MAFRTKFLLVNRVAWGRGAVLVLQGVFFFLTAQPKAGAVLDLLVVFFCRFVGELNQASARPKKVPD